MKQTTYIMVKPHFANFDKIIDLHEESLKELSGKTHKVTKNTTKIKATKTNI